MNNMLSYILDTRQPVRDILIDTLSPSELMDLCIATRTYLSAYEKKKYMNPLRELFYSLAWADKLISDFSDIALLGRDIGKLSDSRSRGLNLWLLTYIPSERLDFTGVVEDSDSDSEILKELRSMSNVPYVRDDVEITSLTEPEPELVTTDKRLRIYVCVMDAMRTFTLSLNSLTHIVKEPKCVDVTNELRDFRYVRSTVYCKDIEVQMPYILYTSYLNIVGETCRRVRTGIDSLILGKYHFRSCSSCRDIIWTSVRMNEFYWPSNSIIGTMDIRWRLWYLHLVCNYTPDHTHLASRIQFDTL